MERNLDLIRDILIAAEAGDLKGIESPKIAGSADYIVRYHVALLVEAGYLRGISVNLQNDAFPTYLGIRLTWTGHDFLDATRSSKVWSVTKAAVSAAGGWTMELVKIYAQQQLKQVLGLPPG